MDVCQTEEEFTGALIDSGIYDPAEEAAKTALSPWIKSFQTKFFADIRRTPTFIEFGDNICIGGEITCVDGFILERPCVVNLLQTEEEFTAALKISGLI